MPNLYNRYVEKSNDTTRKRTNKIILLTSKQKQYMIVFERERFLQSIRDYKVKKREWQERINKELDAKEAEIRRIKASGYYEIREA